MRYYVMQRDHTYTRVDQRPYLYPCWSETIPIPIPIPIPVLINDKWPLPTTYALYQLLWKFANHYFYFCSCMALAYSFVILTCRKRNMKLTLHVSLWCRDTTESRCVVLEEWFDFLTYSTVFTGLHVRNLHECIFGAQHMKFFSHCDVIILSGKYSELRQCFL